MARVEIGSTPHEEDCASFGTPLYYERAQIECRIFARQIERLYGTPPEGCKIFTYGSNYDGDRKYYEVAIKYNDEIESCVDYAFSAENDEKKVLGKWDEQAREELHKEFIKAGLLQAA